MWNEEKSIKYLLAEKQVLIPISACLLVTIFFIANFILNLVLELIETTFSDVFHPKPFHIEFSYFFQMHIGKYPLFYLIIFMLALVTVLKIAYNLRSSFKDLNRNQKGSSRFTTEGELQAQYKAVPERKDRYKGGGGVVISRLNDKILIDDSLVNNLIIGTTRSGKGETFVFPTIDVYSRAEKQPSLILNDPKGELFAASKGTLEERGYHIEVLNLLNPIESMSYNLLEVIKEAYKEKDYSTAQALCKTLSHTLYYNPNVKDPFWQQCAMSLCNAMILAITDKCIKEGIEEKITMYAVANMLSELGSQEIMGENDEPQNALDMYFQSLPADSVAKMQYATSNFSKGTTRGGIFTQTMNGLSIFTFDEIAKMTAKNSMDLKTVGFGKSIKGNASPRSRVKIVFPDRSTETIKTDSQGRFELNFQQGIQVGDKIQILEKESNKKTIVSVKEIDKDTGETVFEAIENSSYVSVKSIKYFNKPIAIFMVTPDYDSSNHVIASIFVRQLYSTLAKYASLASGGKCYREVVFILDEFGNMPSIEGMATIVTVCLGRNIRFNLIIQAYAQLKNKYGDDAPTIDGNCGNTIYILTNDQDTAEKISKKLGEKTINSTSRSGKTLSTDKSKTESVDARPLLTPNELMSLEEGESVVIRVIKRQDVERKRIRPRPIFNTGKTALKYRWEYLSEEFNTDCSLLDIDINSLHVDVNPSDLVVKFFEEEPELEQGEQEEKEQGADGSTQVPSNPTADIEDSPFTAEAELSIHNWKTKTVAEFFESDVSMLKIIETQLLKELNQTLEEVKVKKMEEFYESFKLLGNTDRVSKSVYQALDGKINRILKDLEKQQEEAVASAN